ncbi:MbeB family mobilization protein, partial [Raoultella ornithinolytica]|uniref:MbeB family mobilization protein n=1 Tax=Raoultella ornithinolytica TaxID=54291 RepID=UPI001F0BF03A
MSKILDMAKDFEQSSKQQANAIEKRLTEEFTRHEKAISGALKSSEEKMSAAIAEHSQKMGWLLLKTWIWMLVSIVLFLSATSGILWYQGELIAERQATLQALAEKGGKLKLTQCGKKLEHLLSLIHI